MKKLIQFGLIVAITGLFFARVSRAQSETPQDQSQQPIAPEQPIGAESPSTDNSTGDANTIPALITADAENLPPGSVLQHSFGVPPEHSYIQPRVDVQAAINTNAAYSSGSNPNGLSGMETVLGGITLQKVGATNDLFVNYQGGRSFFSSGEISDSTVQNFGLSDKWVGRRWSGILADQMSYTSDPIFGVGLGGIGGEGTGVSIQPIFTPQQTVITPRTPTLNNSTAAEADYQLSLRASLSFEASYSFLHFYGPGLINSAATNIQAGYNYRLNSQDTIGGIYRFGSMSFGGNAQSLKEHIVEAAYSHTITNRLRFQVAGGPTFAFIDQKGFPSQTYFSWTLNASLNYQAAKRTTASVNYNHGVTGGGGVFTGGSSDYFTAGVTYQLSKNWSANGNGGYGRTATLPIQMKSAANSVDTVVGGASISRAFGRTASLGLTYQGYFQTSGQAVCSGPTCGTSLTNQYVSLTFSWHPVPWPID